ncbi:MAG: autotransporter-associated beta strand repeat-containing protein [Pseudomonadota bacterium]
MGISGPILAQDLFTWENMGGNNQWTLPGNWTPNPGGGGPNGLDVGVIFDVTSDFTSVNLSIDRTIGSMRFDDARAYTIMGGAGDELIFDVTTGTALMTIDNSNGDGAHVISNDILLADDLLITQRSASPFLLSGTVTGAQAVTLDGIGTIVLTGTNNYSGVTTIDAGTLQIGNGGTSGSIAGNVVTNSLLAFHRSDDFTFGNFIGGIGSLRKLGAGTLTLTSANTFSGTTTIEAGSLELGNTLALQNSTVILNVDNGLLLTGLTQLGALAGSGDLDMGSFNALSVGQNNQSTTYSGLLTGLGAFSKDGTGTLILTGDQTRTSITGIQAGGTLQLGNGGTSGSLNGNVVTEGTLTFNRSDDLVYGRVISGTGRVTQIGDGVVTLTQANSYSGGTFIEAGTLTVGNASALGTGLVLIDGAALAIDGFTLNNLVAFAHAGGLISGTGMVDSTVFNAVQIGASDQPVSRAGIQVDPTITGDFINELSGDIFSTERGVFLSNPATSLAGDFINHASIVSEEAGAIQITGALDGTFTNTGDLVAGGGFGDHGIRIGGTVGNGFTNSGQIGTLDQSVGGDGILFDGVVVGDFLNDVGGDIFSSDNGISVFSGMMGNFTNRAAISTEDFFPILVSGDVGGSFTNTGDLLAGSVFGSDGIVVSGTVGAVGPDRGFINAGRIGTVLRRADGEGIQISGTLTGDFVNQISGEILSNSHGIALFSDITGNFTNHAAIDSQFSSAIRVSNVVGGDFFNSGTLSGGTLGIELGGLSGQFVNSGTITGANDTGVEITLTQPSSFDNQAGGMISGHGRAVEISENGVTFSNAGLLNGDVVLGAIVSRGDAGNAQNAVTLDSSGTINGTLNIGTNTSTTVMLNGAGPRSLSSAVTGGIQSGAVSNRIAGSLVKAGVGQWTIDQDLAVGQGTAIDNGTLQLGDGGAVGIIHGSVVINDLGKLVFNRSDSVNFAGSISGSGSVIKSGMGSLTLSGLNDYTGSTTIENGTLRTDNLSGGVINTSGTFSPGQPVAITIISGSFDQGEFGTLRLDIGGTIPGDEYDVLSLEDSADLNGLIWVELINGFRPAVGDQFTLITNTATITDSGVVYSLPEANGLEWDVSLTSNELVLELIADDGVFADSFETSE